MVVVVEVDDEMKATKASGANEACKSVVGSMEVRTRAMMEAKKVTVKEP